VLDHSTIPAGMGRAVKHSKGHIMPTAPTKLTSEEPAALGNTLPLWHMADGRDALHRAFRFRDFSAA
jgi:hypothetical protein